MTLTSKNIAQYLLATDGVNQTQRFGAALNPANLKIDERSLADLLRFVSDLSSQVRFYDQQKQQQGDWWPFFDFFRNGLTLLSPAQINTLVTTRSDVSPHLALLLAFLKIYSYAQNDLNTLTKKRLDYYYQEVLQLQRSSAQPDQVHIIFELGKNASPVVVKKNMLLEAGKTPTGLPLQYSLDSDMVVNQATIASLKSSFIDHNKSGKGIIFKAQDATAVLNDTATSWRPFGAEQLSIAKESRTMEEVSFGWAIASPNFFLAEGNRIIKLEFQLKSSVGKTFPGLVLSPLLDISLTGQKGWLQPDQILKAELTPGIPVVLQDPAQENPFQLSIWVLFNEASPVITAYNEAIHQGTFSTAWPVMHMLIHPESFMLENLSGFRVEQVSIGVEVTGMKNLILQNDQAIQQAGKPVLPFGSTPLIGANFYIGSQEAFSKTVTSLNVNLEWQDPPQNFADYYSAYGNTELDTFSFTGELELLSGKNWNTHLAHPSLFNSVDTSQIQPIVVDQHSFLLETAGSAFARNPDLKLPASFDGTQNQGFLRLVLSGPTRNEIGNEPAVAPFEAFGNKSYPVIYTQQVIALSQFTPPGTPPVLPKVPYTPTLKSVTLDYTANDVLILSNQNTIDQYFLQDIFGPVQINKNDSATLTPSLPGNGALYIGLKNATAPQSFSFLFQIEEGSVPGDTLLTSQDLTWSYLAGDHWQNILPVDVIEESTIGLQKPGLIRLSIGDDASLDHTLMPAALRWLRVSVQNNPDGAAAVINILTQAARGTLVLPAGVSSGYEDHLSTLLDPETISRFVVKIPSIKKIHQPYRSFGGRASESDAGFYTRASERLRHKNRAVVTWDYERLLLQLYPEIYKLKCLPHMDEDNTVKPGNVWIVVVPDWRKRPSGDPLQPKANRSLLRDIKDFISDRYTSPFAAIHVTNPTYETLLVDCKVSFNPGFDPGYYSAVLEEDVKRFLSPWAYSEGQDIVFGGKIHASEILAFIEGREYVDFIIDFELYHRHPDIIIGGIGDMEIGFDFIIGYSPDPSISASDTDTGGKTIGVDFVVGVPVEVASATRPDSILVSNSSHRIEALQAGTTNCQGIQTIGIGEMIIGLDFIIIS